jgi:hypothetical protein
MNAGHDRAGKHLMTVLRASLIKNGELRPAFTTVSVTPLWNSTNALMPKFFKKTPSERPKSGFMLCRNELRIYGNSFRVETELTKAVA